MAKCDTTMRVQAECSRSLALSNAVPLTPQGANMTSAPFNSDKVDYLIEECLKLWPNAEFDAAFHIAAVLLGLSPCNEAAQRLLATVAGYDGDYTEIS